MKFLGHAWVAVNARPQGNRKLLILGSILPEIMYYTKDHPFEFEEIHEGGKKVYQYLTTNKPEWSDLGLGMVAHSARWGADKYNLDENLATLGYEGGKVDELRTRLTSVLRISYEAAKTRAHSILELAVELSIIRDNPKFISEFNKAIADQKTRGEIKIILADCFQKPQEAVSKSVDELLSKAKSVYFENAEGLANFWAELSKEFDPPPKIKELAKLLEELSEGYSGKDEEFLRRCINWTKKNLESFSNHTGRK